MTRSQNGALLLSCAALSSATPCRFIPALSLITRSAAPPLHTPPEPAEATSGFSSNRKTIDIPSVRRYGSGQKKGGLKFLYIYTFAQPKNGGLIVLPNPVADENRELVARTAARHALPAIYAYRYYVTSGGLMSYGIDTDDQFKKAASYVDRILKGAKPADLPVEQPTKFELVINLKTAKALGLTIPPSLLLRAHQVIE